MHSLRVSVQHQVLFTRNLCTVIRTHRFSNSTVQQAGVQFFYFLLIFILVHFYLFFTYFFLIFYYIFLFIFYYFLQNVGNLLYNQVFSKNLIICARCFYTLVLQEFFIVHRNHAKTSVIFPRGKNLCVMHSHKLISTHRCSKQVLINVCSSFTYYRQIIHMGRSLIIKASFQLVSDLAVAHNAVAQTPLQSLYGPAKYR